MRVFLQQVPVGIEPPKYIQLTLQPDLFGSWELLRETGHIGGRSQLRRELFPNPELASNAFEKARDSQLKRGFQVMFVSGTPPQGNAS
jgi:predicted DNA-binding WGR domain protein